MALKVWLFQDEVASADLNGNFATVDAAATAALTAATTASEAAAAAAEAATNAGTSAAAAIKEINGSLPDGSGHLTIAIPDYTAGSGVTIVDGVISVSGGTTYNRPPESYFTPRNFAATTHVVDHPDGPLTIVAELITNYTHALNYLDAPIPPGPFRVKMKIGNMCVNRQAAATGLYVTTSTGQVMVFGFNQPGTLVVYVFSDANTYSGLLLGPFFYNCGPTAWLEATFGTPDLAQTESAPNRISLRWSNSEDPGVQDWMFVSVVEPFGTGVTYSTVGFGVDTMSTLDYDGFTVPRIAPLLQWSTDVPVGNSDQSNT